MFKKYSVNILIFVFALSAGYFLASISHIKPVDTQQKQSIEIAQTAPAAPDLEFEVIDEVKNWLDENRPEFSIKLLEIGEGYHGDEVPAKNGDEWLGLFRDGENYRVRPEKLRIKLVHDPVVDGYEDEGIHSGKSVDVAGANKPLFLIKGGNKIKAAKALTFYRGISDSDYDDLSQRDITIYKGGYTTLDKDFQDTLVTPDKETYELKVIKAKNKRGERILALSLSNRGNRQVLHTTQTWEEASHDSGWSGQIGRLFWIGDIDRDSKPDLHMELYYHDNVAWRVLFLSSEASEDQHVGLAAEFTTTGC